MFKSSKSYLVKIFFICFFLSIVNCYFFEWINQYLHCTLSNPLDKDPIYEQFLIGVLVAPIIETWLFQYLPNKILIKTKITNRYALLIIPGLIFGMAHISYSWLYGLAMFFAGLVLNFFFLKAQASNRHYFWLTALLHSFYNLFCFSMVFLFG
jgi:uncharacterized protein